MDFSNPTLTEPIFSGLTSELGGGRLRSIPHTAITAMLSPCISTTTTPEIDHTGPKNDRLLGPLKPAHTHESLGSSIRSSSMLSDANSNSSDLCEAKHVRNDAILSYPFTPSGLPLHYGLVQRDNGGNSGPFTASQIRELQHQALIFKYIRDGHCIPIDLLVPFRNSFLGLSSMVPGPHQLANMGWGSFHLGFANNSDPEPGRCRRTDGKKWRCSRDVVPDQKYCERHMHRGRHRSKKAIDKTQSNSSHLHVSATASSSNPATSSSLAGCRGATAISNGLRPSMGLNKQPNGLPSNLGVESISSTNSPAVATDGIRLSSHTPSHFQLPFESASGSSALCVKDYRYLNGGAKNDIDLGLQQMFSDSSHGILPASSPINGLSMLNNSWKASDQPKQQHQLFEGSRFRATVDDLSGSQESEGQPLRHFFDDWPRSRDVAVAAVFSWSDVDNERSNHSSSTTQLSMSIPMDPSTEFTASNTSSPRGKLPFSSLKLSMCGPGDDEELGMRLGMNDDISHETTWNPISWEAGPLGEVLQSSSSTPSGCKSSGLNLMDDGWDNSPQHDSPAGSAEFCLQQHS